MLGGSELPTNAISLVLNTAGFQLDQHERLQQHYSTSCGLVIFLSTFHLFASEPKLCLGTSSNDKSFIAITKVTMYGYLGHKHVLWLPFCD